MKTMIRLRHTRTRVGVVCMVEVRGVRTRVVLCLNPGGHGRSGHLVKKVDRAIARRTSGAKSWDPANTCTKRTGDIPMRQLHKDGQSVTFPIVSGYRSIPQLSVGAPLYESILAQRRAASDLLAVKNAHLNPT
jgi:hypothetical protein